MHKRIKQLKPRLQAINRTKKSARKEPILYSQARLRRNGQKTAVLECTSTTGADFNTENLLDVRFHHATSLVHGVWHVVDTVRYLAADGALRHEIEIYCYNSFCDRLCIAYQVSPPQSTHTT